MGTICKFIFAGHVSNFTISNTAERRGVSGCTIVIVLSFHLYHHQTNLTGTLLDMQRSKTPISWKLKLAHLQSLYGRVHQRRHQIWSSPSLWSRSGKGSPALSLPFSSVFRTGNWEGCIQNEQLKDTYEFHFGAFTLKMGLENSCLKFLFCLGPTSVNQRVMLMILIDFVATGVPITSMHSGADLQPSNVQVTPLHPAGACCQAICTASKCFKDALLMAEAQSIREWKCKTSHWSNRGCWDIEVLMDHTEEFAL